MMGLDNPLHIVFLLVVVLLVFGAKRLPEMGRSLGAGLRGFKDSMSGDHDHESLLSVTEDAPTGVDGQPQSAQVNGDQVNGDRVGERVPTHPVG